MNDKKRKFKCRKCGACCRHISDNEHLRFMADNSGCCIFLKDNLCAIYEKRPIFCRVEEAYEKFFADILPYDRYIECNENACELLREKGT